jgi:hypothetical protein
MKTDISIISGRLDERNWETDIDGDVVVSVRLSKVDVKKSKLCPSSMGKRVYLIVESDSDD